MGREIRAEEIECVTILLAELRAIEVWDNNYWRQTGHKRWEIIAMLSRRKRWTVVLALLKQSMAPEVNGRPALVRNERRRHVRTIWENDVRVHSRTFGVLPGRGVDISENGMTVILPVELQLGDLVNIHFEAKGVESTVAATVRNRNVFRHGFEFLNRLHSRPPST